MAEKKGETIVETATEARGAERGPTVRNVLVWSLGRLLARRSDGIFIAPFEQAIDVLTHA
jgi:hypothetical protein